MSRSRQKPAPKPKNRTGTWLAALAVVVILGLTAGVVTLATRPAPGPGNAVYCAAFAQLSNTSRALNVSLSAALQSGDLTQVSAALGDMAAVFKELKATNPPDTAVVPLETVLTYLTTLKGIADSGDGNQYNTYSNANGQTDLVDAVGLIVTASETYCNLPVTTPNPSPTASSS